MKTYWKVDYYMATIRKVTEEAAKDSHGLSRTSTQYFNTKQEAVDYKVQQLETQIAQQEKNLANTRLRLKKFIRKHAPEKVG